MSSNKSSKKDQLLINKLRVPSLNFSDKTPTPTKLLRILDEHGIFRDDQDHDQIPQSAKSTSSNNPFDEHFRKALTSNTTERPSSSNVDEGQHHPDPTTNDDMLNTPQIMTLQDIQSAPSSAKVIQISSSISTPSSLSTSPLKIPGGGSNKSHTLVRPIAPKMIESDVTTNQLDRSNNTNENSAAQLLIRMPSGKTIKLSKIPFYLQGFEAPTPASDDYLAIVEKVKTKSYPQKSKIVPENNASNFDLKERNRAAASRSRLKRKNKNEAMTLKIEEIMKQNRNLQSENQILKKEVVKLKEKLKQFQATSADNL